ncbi:ectonucleoside triphosphate diphosphohydrolase 8-like [Apteryx mantelli]|uniref:Ectonucleoside triphosphate diphosphohydrolase 8-like n=1 Tax=Apteryx mantelli TaxID=2696672 RepID=A0A8B7JFQ8_9AVES|nr:PREDICTED: ectonucleoside triphosphate diphosphohydrolase 8-like [Apteryx mantelli mantelli]XP_025919857.1 ectonucleoside triphosphate diphosphohydrolase 8-like [Apteryx rowi]
MMFTNKKHLISAVLGALAMFSIIALVLSLVKIKDVTLPPTVKYGIVFDAGSSHTSLFVYEWDSDKENNTGVVSQTLSCDVQGQGISSYASNPPKAGESLRECLDKALKVIPPAKQREVPAYLGATAGMRLLREQNSSAADQVLAEIARTMQEYPVDFHGARIITGEEEGAYGWITINYLLDSFTKYYPKEHMWVHPEVASIFGALDLGGASTQISFIPKGSVIKWNETSKFTLYGYNYNIYTHSYLCYGQNEVLKRLAKELIAESSSSTQVEHPCYPKNYNETISLSSFHTSPCTSQNDLHLTLADRNVTLEGRGNASRCLAAIKKLFNFSACSESQNCTFNGVYQPPVSGQFFAFSAFYYNFRFLNLTNGQPLATVRETIQNFCTRSWEDLSSSYPKEKPERLRSYCANANYILTLLLDAYKFNETSWNSIIFQMKAGSMDIGWTLGYMLNLTNMIPAEALEWVKGHDPSLWAAAVAFIVLTLALGLVALLMRLWL